MERVAFAQGTLPSDNGAIFPSTVPGSPPTNPKAASPGPGFVQAGLCGGFAPHEPLLCYLAFYMGSMSLRRILTRVLYWTKSAIIWQKHRISHDRSMRVA